MEKYYFNQDLKGISKTEKCEYTKNEFLSKECKTCVNNKGFDKEEEYVKCLLYDKDIDIIGLLELLQKSNNDRIEEMQKKIELEAKISYLDNQIKKGSA
jgi:hypothetical protein